MSRLPITAVPAPIPAPIPVSAPIPAPVFEAPNNSQTNAQPQTNTQTQESTTFMYDQQFDNLQQTIKHKREFLRQKKGELEKTHKTNSELTGVKDDYKRYYDYILAEKQKQYDALKLLNTYISDLINSDKIMNEQMQLATADQEKILAEIKKVKNELDTLIQN